VADEKEKPELDVPPRDQVEVANFRENDQGPRGDRFATTNPADYEQPTPYAVEGNDVGSYVGVSNEYATYASDTEKPLYAEEGVLADLEEAHLGKSYDTDSPTLMPSSAPEIESETGNIGADKPSTAAGSGSTATTPKEEPTGEGDSGTSSSPTSSEPGPAQSSGDGDSNSNSGDENSNSGDGSTSGNTTPNEPPPPPPAPKAGRSSRSSS
jgi:hypothetical protein